MHNAGIYSSRGTYARMHCPSYSVEITDRSPHDALSTSSSAVHVFKQDEARIPEQQDGCVSDKVPLQYLYVLIVLSLLCLGRHVSAMPHSQEREWLLLRHGHLSACRAPLVHARLPEQVELERPAGHLPVPVEQAASGLHGAQLHAVRRRGSHGDPHVRLRRGSAVRRLRQDSSGAAVQPRQGADDHRRRRDDVADRFQGHDGLRARAGLVRAAPVQGVPLLRHGVLRLIADAGRGVPGP